MFNPTTGILQGKNILITGASSGIGAALSTLLAGYGNNLFLFGRDDLRLLGISKACLAHAPLDYTCTSHSIDVRRGQDMHSAIVAIDQESSIDIVIASAGVSYGSAARVGDPASIRDIMEVNFLGVVNTVSPLIDRWKASGHSGQIVIICSMVGLLSLPSCLEYSASKNALRCYGESLSTLLRGSGVGVSIVYPGFVQTPMTAVNKFPMPLQMDSNKAARIIARGIALRKHVIAFPYILYLLMKCVAILPLTWRIYLLAKLPHKE